MFSRFFARKLLTVVSEMWEKDLRKYANLTI